MIGDTMTAIKKRAIKTLKFIFSIAMTANIMTAICIGQVFGKFLEIFEAMNIK